MKNIFPVLVLFFVLVSFVGCDSDGQSCSGVYVDGECVPDFVFPPNNEVKEGAKFYHKKYGVIVFTNGNWENESTRIITKNELLLE
ncbi:hypothetical protein [Formosa algae]|uniref:Uncharacterized protein n=1 Tax=Formosa algae TaxID=225843 RepID=A0A9X1CCI3_9FLAO|nr:hypothetical protein [Formosa algae]MBP1840214.1 hypothetical protein [Formosa algae]MDQ0335814.1 hypothetical protein [Formosa algae]OEI80972.1 hypothetical protein AST99_06345 [Formosa algae]